MKRLLLFVVVSFFSFGVMAQEDLKHDANIRLNPVGLLFGVANLGADFAVNENFTLGGNVSYWNLDVGSSEADVFGYGVRGQLFFDEVFTDSWYAAASVSLSQARARNTNSGNEASVDGFTISGIIGYMWIWDNFNMQLGGGVQIINLDETANSDIDFAGLGGTLPTIEYSLGWAF